jgi:hypothetical protein
MARKKTTDPTIQTKPGQINLEVDDFIYRRVDQWNRPRWIDANLWRRVVDSQPVCVDCRETIISQLISFDYKIDSRDSKQRDELKGDIDFYNNLLENSGEVDYVGLTEWLIADYLDIPFGGAVEVGREGDEGGGRVRWIIPLDGATLFPWPNYDWPVGQTLPYNQLEKVYFPRHAINRLYMSPRREIDRSGWGMAPPEKIYMALEMLNRGDRYYANLLLDTPEAGILDLGDMASDSAKQWIKGWQEMLAGIDPFKIPVLYEHEKPAVFIPFVRSPADLMFDKAILKYAALVTSGYGLSLSDINVPQVSSGGDTLAGSIRGERKTRRTGIARTKKSLVAFWNRILPPELQFNFIDLDDEVSVALSRARLANATAAQILQTARMFSNKELRRQTIADGLMSIPLPEDPPEDELPPELPPPGPNGFNTQKNLLGKPVPASGGGQGEIKSRTEEIMESLIQKAYDTDDSFKNAYEEVKSNWKSWGEEEREFHTQSLQQMLESFALSPDFQDEMMEQSNME